MTPEDYKILKEKAELWDSLSDCLKTQFAAKFPYSETLQNTSNASSHVEVLEEEIEEWCGYCSQPIKNHAKV
jgi:hypothetical protein